MKKIKTVFIINRKNNLATDKVLKENEWVLNGEGKATMKFDGTSSMIKDGILFRRWNRKLTKKAIKDIKLAKLDGIVCSGHEANFLKRICKNMEIITPGIRLSGDSKGDQKRVMTPDQAFKNGATAIVMGRSITKGNIFSTN